MQVSSRYRLFALSIVAGIALIGLFVFSPRTPARDSNISDTLKTVVLKNQSIHIVRADTPEKRAQGLGSLSGLAPDQGMLFIFPTDGVYAFWMKDMLFSIDIMWLSSDGTINYIQKRVAPSTYPASFSPPIPGRYVLELSAGYVDMHDIKIGDRVSL